MNSRFKSAAETERAIKLALFFMNTKKGGAQMKYTEYGVIWEDGIERCSDTQDETEEEQEES